MKTKAPPLSDSDTQLDALLARKSFDQLLKDGDLLDLEAARAKLGYSGWGLRLLCRRGKIGCVLRGDRYFFLPSQVREFLTVKSPRP